MFALSSVLIVISNVTIVLFVFFKGNRGKVSNIFCIFCFFPAVWGFAGYKFSTALSAPTAFFWWQIAYIAVIATPVLYSHLILTILKVRRKWFLRTIYLLGVAALLLVLAYHLLAIMYYLTPRARESIDVLH